MILAGILAAGVVARDSDVDDGAAEAGRVNPLKLIKAMEAATSFIWPVSGNCDLSRKNGEFMLSV